MTDAQPFMLVFVLGILLGAGAFALVGKVARGPGRWFPEDEDDNAHD